MHGMEDNSVDLIYLDPPFNTKKVFSAPIGSKAAGAAFDDMWTWDDVDKQYLEEMITDYPFLVNTIQAIEVIHSKNMKAYITYMAQRIIEMKRILKDNGSFYLHCDPTASHYLKIVCDRIFGKTKFKSNITWQRNSSHNDSKSFGNVSDIILFYGNNINVDEVRVPLNHEYVKKFYKYSDEKGQYQADNLSAKGLSGGGYEYDFHGHNGPWRYPEKEMIKLEKDNRIHFPLKVGGVPRYKRYLSENKGQVPNNIWTDISKLQSKNEKTGYPTQKPLALLDRIIKASSKPGDIVLDPFCGCATTCVSAQRLNRKWIGIDLSSKAVDLVIDRIGNDSGLFTDFVHYDCIADSRTYPKRANEINVNPKDVRNILFKKQKGKCNACLTEMDERHFEVDHIIPKSKNGSDTLENYQLLCSSCNRIKGDRPMQYLNMRIKHINDLKKFRLSFGNDEENE